MVRTPPGEDFLLGLLRVVLASEFPDDSSCHRTVLPFARLDESKISDLSGKRFFVLLKASLHHASLCFRGPLSHPGNPSSLARGPDSSGGSLIPRNPRTSEMNFFHAAWVPVLARRGSS